jgi:hypothetical protein
MIEKVSLNELTLKPAGTLADGAAVDDGADDGADVGAVVVAVVVAEVLFELLLHAAISATSPRTATPPNNRRGWR